AVWSPGAPRLAAPRARRLRLLDQRADDVGLPALAQEPGQPAVRLRGAALLDPAGHHRPAGGGRLRDLAHRQVAVHGQRERPRDRRRGHVQDVRRASLGQGFALLHAEAVLLVADRDGEVARSTPSWISAWVPTWIEAPAAASRAR